VLNPFIPYKYLLKDCLKASAKGIVEAIRTIKSELTKNKSIYTQYALPLSYYSLPSPLGGQDLKS